MSKGALSRLANVIRAGMDDVVNKIEDPKKMVRQMIVDMEEALEDAVVAVSRAVANEKVLEKRIATKREEAAHWERKAEVAVGAGEEGLARKALMQKVAVDEAAEALEKARGEANEVTTMLKQRLVELKAKLDSAKARQGALALRKGAARARTELRGNAGIAQSEAFARYDQYCQDIAREEMTAQVYAEIAGASDPALDESFERLAKKQRVEDELKALKDKLNQAQS